MSALALLSVGALFATPALAQTDPGQSGTAPTPATADLRPGSQNDPNRNPAVPTSGSADTANADSTATAGDDIVVTGTLFRRTNTETPSPVSVLTSQNLDQRGITDIATAVQTIAAGNGGAIPQGFGAAFAAGSQGISLRGLTTDSTLTLFDGLREASYPLADDGARSFVDLNTIPDAIVDRVEVLRDGASATYGADAVAGVVNVILKKQITGIDGRFEGGVTQRGDRGNNRIQLTIGHGDLAEQGYNFYISGEYQRESELFDRDRGFPYNTTNLSSINAGGGFTGRNTNFGFVPPSATASSGATVAVIRPATESVAGNILSGVAVPGGLFSVLGAGGCAGGNLISHTNAAGTYCEQDLVNQYGVILPYQQRYGGTAHLTVNVGSQAQAYLVGTFYENHVTADAQPATVRSSSPINTRGVVLPALLSNGALDPYDPYAQAGQAALLYYRFGDIPVKTDVRSKTYRVATGIDGTFGDKWGYSIAGTFSRTVVDINRTGFINLPGLTTAINTGAYNFINPSANTDAVRQLIAPAQSNHAKSELGQIQATLTKEVFQLPGGPLQVGVGGQLRYENIYDPNADTPLVTLNINTFQAIGHRFVEAGYFEIAAPVLTQLEIDASGRYDHYSEGFDHFSPKVGAKFTPIKQLSLRGTFSKGFRAPSIPETSGAVIGFTPYTPGASLTAAQKAALSARYGNDSYITTTGTLGLFSAGNPNLKPETSTSFTGGIVVQPKPWLSFTVDYYNIRKKNLIIQNAGGANIADGYLLNGVVPQGYTVTPSTPDPSFPNNRAVPFSVNALYSNGQSLQTSGIDAQIQATIPITSNVKFTSILEGTEVLEYTIDTNGPGQNDPANIFHYVGTLGSYNITSASGTPRWRANWQNTMEAGPYSLSATTYFTSGYKGYADDNSGGGSTCANAITTSVMYATSAAGALTSTTGGALQCTVKHFIDVDLTAQVKVNSKFTLYGTVQNLLDAHAPFDPNTYGGNNYNPAWSTAGIIGRSFRAGATFKF